MLWNTNWNSAATRRRGVAKERRKERWRHLFWFLVFGSVRFGLVVGQPYDLDASIEYVIRGNSAIIKCQYPSFMSDFLRVESWTIDDMTVATYSVDDYGTFLVAMETTPPTHPPTLATPPAISIGVGTNPNDKPMCLSVFMFSFCFAMDPDRSGSTGWCCQ